MSPHRQHRCRECDSTWTDADLPGRSIGMLEGDQFLNNTDYELFIFDPDENQIACVGPGQVFVAPYEMTVMFDANIQYTFRSYLGPGYPRNG